MSIVPLLVVLVAALLRSTGLVDGPATRLADHRMPSDTAGEWLLGDASGAPMLLT